MDRTTALYVSTFLALACAGQSTADVVYSPTLQAGDKFHLVFTTSGTTDAKSDDINTYNTFVTTQAGLGGLGTVFGQSVTWKAIASTGSVDARDNIGNPASPIFNTMGQLVADNEADLWDGSIDHSIRGDQFGNLAGFHAATGSETNGVADGSFPLGPASTLFAISGDTRAANSTWIDNGFIQNGAAFGIYAISSEITFNVPEPSSLAIAGLGGLLVARRRRY